MKWQCEIIHHRDVNDAAIRDFPCFARLTTALLPGFYLIMRPRAEGTKPKQAGWFFGPFPTEFAAEQLRRTAVFFGLATSKTNADADAGLGAH